MTTALLEPPVTVVRHPGHPNQKVHAGARGRGPASRPSQSTSASAQTIPSTTEQDKSIASLKDFTTFMDARRPTTLFTEHGRGFYMGPQTFKGPRGKQHHCYMNATKAVWKDSSLTYVEGYVSVHGVPIAHAWAVTRSGTVIDSTTRSTRGIGGYYGVPFKREYLDKALARSGYYGLISHTNPALLNGRDKDFAATLRSLTVERADDEAPLPFPEEADYALDFGHIIEAGFARSRKKITRSGVERIVSKLLRALPSPSEGAS